MEKPLSIQNPKEAKPYSLRGAFSTFPQVMSDKLESVTDTQDGDAQLEEARIRVGRVRLIDTFGPPDRIMAPGLRAFILSRGRL